MTPSANVQTVAWLADTTASCSLRVTSVFQLTDRLSPLPRKVEE
jgi:hypothetical protein